MTTPLTPVVKTTASGHQQRYWISPEAAKTGRVLPVAAPSAENQSVSILPKQTHIRSYFPNRGMKWQNIPDKNFRKLAEDRASEYDSYDSYDDFWDNHDGSIELEFYGHASSLTLRSIDSEAIGVFRYGQCAVLAYALHELTDAPIAVFTSADAEPGSWSGHAGLAASDGTILDITGFQTVEEIKGEYPGISDPIIMSGPEFLELVSTGNPWDSLEDLERYVVMDFASYLLSENVEGY